MPPEVVMRAEDAVVRVELTRFEDERAAQLPDWVLGRLECEMERDGSDARVSLALCFTKEHLAEYASELEALYRSLDGEADLWSRDPRVSLSIKMTKGRGLVSVAVLVGEAWGRGELTLSSTIDQSYLPEAIAGCEALLVRFPDRGEPGR